MALSGPTEVVLQILEPRISPICGNPVGVFPGSVEAIDVRPFLIFSQDNSPRGRGRVSKDAGSLASNWMSAHVIVSEIEHKGLSRLEQDNNLHGKGCRPASGRVPSRR